MQASAGNPELLNHFSVLIYPFLHDITARNRDARLEALEPRWVPWWSRLTNRELTEALEATGFFLPYIRGLIYPETIRLHEQLPGEGYDNWAQLISLWTAAGTAFFCRDMPAGSIIRLTCREAWHDRLANFTLSQRRPASDKAVEQAALPVRLDWLDALLFPSGIGFLLLKVRLRSESPGLAELIELNRQLRLVHPPTLAWSLPLLQVAEGEAFSLRDLINQLTQGIASPFEPHANRRVPLPPSTRDRAVRPYTETEAGRGYGERCQLLSYACVNLGETEQAQQPAGVFPCGEDRLLYEFATCINLGDAVHNAMWVPSPEQAKRVGRENRLAMWRCWKGMALKESCVFLATEDLPFNKKALAHNIENDYLPLYLYTLYQKFQLFTFANDLMREVAQGGGNLRGARVLLQRFIEFRTQYWFNEITRKPLGGDLYRKLQHGLEVPKLYDMVLTSVKEAKAHYEERHNRQVRLVLDLVALVFGPLAVIAGAIRVFLTGAYPMWAKCLLLMALGIGSAAVLLRLQQAHAQSGAMQGRRRRRGGRPSRTRALYHLKRAYRPLRNLLHR